MLKTLGSTESIIRPRNSRVGVGDNGNDGGCDDSSYDDKHSPYGLK